MTPTVDMEIVREPELIVAAERAQVALRPTPPSLMPVFRGQEMTEAFLAYRELQRALDAAMPEQLMQIRGKTFRKKGYWRAIATAFHLNVTCVMETSTDEGWRAVYRAASQSGRVIDGDGACENEEKGEGQDTEHNVRSHAHTRAFNRAVSNLVGFGEVSAEEVRHTARPAVQPPAPLTAGNSAGARTERESRAGAGPGETPSPSSRPPGQAATAVPLPSKPNGGDSDSRPRRAEASGDAALSPDSKIPPGFHRIADYAFSGGWHEFTLLRSDAQGGALKLSTRLGIGFTAAEAWHENAPVKVTTTPKPKGGPGEAYLQSIQKWSGSDASL